VAYVVARPKARFEIRESVHTPKGPRARSLANFAVLTDDVVAAARARASRPFNAQAVRTAAARVAARVAAQVETQVETQVQAQVEAQVDVPGTSDSPAMRHFVESSRRMAATLERPPSGPRRDAGESLIELMGFADAIARMRPAREPEPLTFPPLARLAELTAAGRAKPSEGAAGTEPPE
jgi:hypothetical protein